MTTTNDKGVTACDGHPPKNNTNDAAIVPDLGVECKATACDDSVAALSDADLAAEMVGYLKGRPSQRWRWISYLGRSITAPQFTLRAGAHADNADPRFVLEALVTANRNLAARRSAAAKKAAATRDRRRHLYGKKLAIRIAGGEVMGPSLQCKVCDKPVTDPESIARGIGSDCWQFVMSLMEKRP